MFVYVDRVCCFIVVVLMMYSTYTSSVVWCMFVVTKKKYINIVSHQQIIWRSVMHGYRAFRDTKCPVCYDYVIGMYFCHLAVIATRSCNVNVSAFTLCL